MHSTRLWLVPLACLTCLLSGCDNMRTSPQVIEADGQYFVACNGLVWVTGTGGLLSDSTSFKVTFTDSGDLKHTIWGVKRLSVSEPPAEAFAPFPPSPPDPKVSVDQNGQAYRSGEVYTWPDGSKAQLSGDKWQPVKVAAACK
jgi:hypothetical protein